MSGKMVENENMGGARKGVTEIVGMCTIGIEGMGLGCNHRNGLVGNIYIYGF